MTQPPLLQRALAAGKLNLGALAAGSLVAAALTACTVDPPPPATSGTYIDFHESTDLAALRAPVADTPPLLEDLREDQRDALERILDAPDVFFARRPPTPVLNEAELVFLAAGRVFELTEMYDDAVQGGITTLRPRLAWMLERTGLHSRALSESARAVEELPEDAEAWFVRGFVLGQQDEATVELLREIRECYAQTVALDPAFVGPSDVTATDIRAQVQGIDRALEGR